MFDFSGKTVLVTGGAKGIGRAIAIAFGNAGAKVGVVDNDEDAIASLKEIEICKSFTKYHVDIRNSDEVSAFDSLKDARIDILVNNAGIDLDAVWGSSDGDRVWQKVIDTNVHGTRRMTNWAFPRMKEHRSGNIIFITSVHTAQAFPGGAAYDASKHALVGMMRAIALEGGPYGVRSNAIAPGAIARAGRTAYLTDVEMIKREPAIPLRRFGTPEDIASAALFLASDHSSYITGHELRVDGGLPIQSTLF